MPVSARVDGTERASYGIGLSLLAWILFACQDASIKLLVARLPPGEVLFCRSVIVFAVCLAVGRTPLIGRAARTPLKGLLTLRAVVLLAAWLCYYTAARELSLAKLITLYFAAPVIATVLAVPFLGERVPPLRWLAVATGFAGVVAACDPTGLGLSASAGLVLIAALLWAISVIAMRRIALGESSLLQMFYSNGAFIPATVILSAAVWKVPEAGEAALLLGVGLVGGFAQFLLLEGARYAPASVLAVTEYSSLLWNFVLGYLIWSNIPPLSVFTGAALILVAGMLLILGERHH